MWSTSSNAANSMECVDFPLSVVYCDFDTGERKGSLKINIFKVIFWKGRGKKTSMLCPL